MIGAQHYTKKMPAEKLALLIDSLKLPAVILGGPGDVKEAEEIGTLSKKSDIVNLAGKVSLDHSARVVNMSEAVITHDTGLMHIAAAYGKKIISIWGNTIPEFGMYPYQPDPASRMFGVEASSLPALYQDRLSAVSKKTFPMYDGTGR